jgi:hypothetical protein
MDEDGMLWTVDQEFSTGVQDGLRARAPPSVTKNA